MDFIPNTDKEREEMLEEIGENSIEDLFSDIPQEIREEFEPLGKDGLSELELTQKIHDYARENSSPENRTSFIGGGLYEHFIPAVVDHITGRSEFYTAYTPYQAEISQGTLTWMFEFQTAISELTGMDIANSSMYDSASATAEAVHMARRVEGGDKVLLAETLNPLYEKVIRTYLPGDEDSIVTVPALNGRLDRKSLEEILKEEDSISCLVLQSPNYLGIVENLSGLKERLGDSFLIVNTNPISLGVLEPPGNFGADIVTGEGQMLGNPVYFGGPLLGLFASRMEYLRYLPGRISGKTVDDENEPGFVMALQTREQHIRRERATSNICTNQALNALAATVYLSYLGSSGFKRLSEINWEKSHYLAGELTDIEGVSLEWEQPFFNEFTISVPGDPHEIREKLKDRGIDILKPDYLETFGLDSHFLIAVTETISREEMDIFKEELKGAL